MKLFLPKQHGAWAMLIIPFWLGVAASGFEWQHIPFFMGWLLLYLATYPLLLLFKGKKISFYRKWTIIYMVPALLLLLIPLWTRPNIIVFGFAMVPFFVVNAYFSWKKNDRALLNDFCAIMAFGIAGLASSFLAEGNISFNAIVAIFASVLFFVGSTFYVKTMIREKNNPAYKRISWSYHVIVPIVFAITGFWITALAFLLSLVRAVYYYGKPMTMKKVGILEIANAAIFFIFIVMAII